MSNVDFRTGSGNVENQEMLSAVEERPLTFGFVDGKVEKICSPSGEATWVLNFKRGILSAFQNSFDGNYEARKGREVEIKNTIYYYVMGNQISMYYPLGAIFRLTWLAPAPLSTCPKDPKGPKNSFPRSNSCETARRIRSFISTL